jgi:hypothetical protein
MQCTMSPTLGSIGKLFEQKERLQQNIQAQEQVQSLFLCMHGIIGFGNKMIHDRLFG